MKKRFLSILMCAAMVASIGSSVSVFAEETEEIKGTGVPLLIYTNGGNEARFDWVVEAAAEDGFVVEYATGGAAEIKDRIIAEKEAPVADIMIELNAFMCANMKAAGALEQYVPSWVENTDKALHDADGYYHAISKTPIIMAVDTNQVALEDAPQDWEDLFKKEEFHGKYEVPTGLSGGTNRIVISGILTRYMDPEGELGISEEGWAAIGDFFKYGVPAEDGVALYAQISNPDSPVLYGAMWSTGVEGFDAEYGTKTGYVVQDLGLPNAICNIAILKNTENLEEAQRFVEWYGSEEVQKVIASEFSQCTTNQLAADSITGFMADVNTAPAQEVDWGFVAENIDAWCEKIMLEYQQ